MLDTASTWVVLSKDLLLYAEVELERGGLTEEKISTRLGTFRGYLERLPLSITAESGDSLQIEATCFICEDWPGPPVIGWKGCLERIRFAIEPSLNRFYFGALAG